jgi:hypothetical protein
MIDPQALLGDLRKLLPQLEDDLRERCAEVAEVDAALKQEFHSAKAAGRTGDAFEVWRDERVTQAAVAWILGCVFVRFLEDNGLVETPRLSGPPTGAVNRLRLARDHHTHYFQQHPTQTDREYLYDVFEGVRQLPAAKELFHKEHNPLWSLGLSGDGATNPTCTSIPL